MTGSGTYKIGTKSPSMNVNIMLINLNIVLCFCELSQYVSSLTKYLIVVSLDPVHQSKAQPKVAAMGCNVQTSPIGFLLSKTDPNRFATPFHLVVDYDLTV